MKYAVVRCAIGDDDPQLVHDFSLADPLEKRAHEAVRHHLGVVARQKLRYSGNPVADNVVQQFSRQPANPVLAVAEQGPGITGIAEVITVVALHVHGRSRPDNRSAPAP